MPLLESFGDGIEVFILDDLSLEVVGAISNLNATSTELIYGNTSYDNTKYKRISSRMKFHVRKDSFQISERGFLIVFMLHLVLWRRKVSFL